MQTIGIIGYLIINFIIIANFNGKIKKIKKTYVESRKQVTVISIENYKITIYRKIYYIIMAIVFMGVNIVVFAIYYNKLPERIPLRFNFEGMAIGFGDKNIGTIISLLSVIVIVVLTYIFADVLLYKVMFNS